MLRSSPFVVLALLAGTACAEDTCPLERDGERPRVVDITASFDVTVATMSDGSGFCWGDDHAGECGIGRAGYASIPRPTNAAPCVRQHSPRSNGMGIGIQSDGSTIVWGTEAGRGEAGDGPGFSNYLQDPFKVAVPAMKLVAAGDGHMLAVSFEGDLYWWGLVHHINSDGFWSGERAEFPRRYPIDAKIEKLAVGYHASCLLDESGAVWCFGINTGGELPLPKSDVGSFTPIRAPLPSRAIDVAMGTASCALLDTREVYCWGTIPVWGTRDYQEVSTPTLMPGFDGIELEVGPTDICVLDESGAATCAGAPLSYAMDIDGVNDDYIGPFHWMPELSFVDLALGFARACGLTVDGKVYCAGLNHGLGRDREGVGGFVDIEWAIDDREEDKRENP